MHKKAKIIYLALILCLLTPKHTYTVDGESASLALPNPTQLLSVSKTHSSPVLKGIKIDPKDPFKLEFIIDTQDKANIDKKELSTLIKYFLAALTIKEEDLWVNLSPYEANRVIPDNLNKTDLGKDLLEEDYILKQLVSSLTYPDSQLGRRYWDKIYKDVQKIAGTTNIPINTFNKVWIIPDKAEVYENGDIALITKARLKVLSEQDYLALSHQTLNSKFNKREDARPSPTEEQTKQINKISSNALKDLILPQIEYDINNGKNFSKLRQMYHSLVLATWFKKKLKDSIYQYYIDQNKTEGIDLKDPSAKDKIYNLYVESFKKGVYDYIKTDVGRPTSNIAGKPIRRRYYSGGVVFNVSSAIDIAKVSSSAMAATKGLFTLAPINLLLTTPNGKVISFAKKTSSTLKGKKFLSRLKSGLSILILSGSLIAGLTTNAKAEASKNNQLSSLQETTFKLQYDYLGPKFQMHTMAENVYTGFNLSKRLLNSITEKIPYVEDTILGRAIKAFTVDPLMARYFNVTMHELGHVARFEESGLLPYSLSITFTDKYQWIGSHSNGWRLGNIWPSFWEGKVVSPKSRPYGSDGQISNYTGGVGSTQILSELVRNKMLKGGNYQDAMLYIFSKRNLSYYFFNSKRPISKNDKNPKSGVVDIESYWEQMLVKYHGNLGFSWRDLKRAAYWNMFDPTIWTSLYYNARYIYNGKKDFKLPDYWPYTGANFTPIGPEYYLGGNFKLPHSLFGQFYTRWGKGAQGDFGGGGLKIDNIKMFDRLTLGLETDYWKQPEGEGLAGYGNARIKVTSKFYANLGFGYKKEGYLLGKPLKEGLLGRGGIEWRFHSLWREGNKFWKWISGNEPSDTSSQSKKLPSSLSNTNAKTPTSSSLHTKGGIDLDPSELNVKSTSSSLQFNLPLETIQAFKSSSGLTLGLL